MLKEAEAPSLISQSAFKLPHLPKLDLVNQEQHVIYSLSLPLATNRAELFQYQFHYMIADFNNLY